MSSEVADLNNVDADDLRVENDVSGLPRTTKSEEEQHEKETLGADDHSTRDKGLGDDDDAQDAFKNGDSGLDSEDHDEYNNGYRPMGPASRLRSVALDKPSLGKHFALKQDILIKIALLPCVLGLRDAMTMNLEAERMKIMRESSRLAVSLALHCNAPDITVARCQFYQALVNMAIGMHTGDSEGERPAFLLDQVINVVGCSERECAKEWLSRLEGHDISTPQKSESRSGLVQRVASWGSSLFPNFSPYKSPPKKTKSDPPQPLVPEALKQMVGTPTTSSIPVISRQSPSTQAPDSARPAMSPTTPTKQMTRTSDPPSGTSQFSRPLSDLYELSPRSGEEGENLDNISMSDWQSRPNSRFSMNSNLSASPNTPSKTLDPSPRRPYPLRHRSSGIDASSGSPTSNRTLPFSTRENSAEEGEAPILPAPNTTRQKHTRSRSLALTLPSPSKHPRKLHQDDDHNIFEDSSSSSSPRRKTSLVNRLGFGRARSEVLVDPHDEAEKGGSPRRKTFVATQEEMEDLMEKGSSPRILGGFGDGDGV
ncbi:uncharacterized protein MYCFIDRAFT_78419 [Pseudocercospora fijiensis CIRAD86]|uniref:Uncharacterized protein n=1 Tax=Pseudocercospora fijiensis (strain CIRAD86) TaxID=383855 RepID=M3AMQ1_PSEFD|nr:uncharacterized protein MYCFIDRAFT_78419 [Pseudocercospora fijiensis CIRAD86]EME78722.1 hypothetical protein MYCFIDRAFT_78419 [Pseudocercospora fijiensis CIRAD86]